MQGLAPVIANAVNPILTILLLGAPYYTPRRTRPKAFWGRSALGVGMAVALAESGKRFGVWPGHPSFPSGHETFGLAVATSLLVRDIRWLWVTLPLLLLLSWSLVAAQYHEPVDLAGSWLIGPPCALLCHLIKRGRAD